MDDTTSTIQRFLRFKVDVLTRDQAIERSQRMRSRCDITVFYTDMGWSSGMKAAKKYCIDNDMNYEERTLDVKSLANLISFCTEEFCDAILNRKSYDSYLE